MLLLINTLITSNEHLKSYNTDGYSQPINDIKKTFLFTKFTIFISFNIRISYSFLQHKSFKFFTNHLSLITIMNYNQTSMSRSKLQHILLCINLACLLNCTNWQAAGSFTQDNVIDVHSIVGFNLAQVSKSNIKITQIATSIQSDLSSKWGYRWNVFVVRAQDKTSDVICFGYTFNHQWLWFNNFQNSGYSFVIWRDDSKCNTQTHLVLTSNDFSVGYSTLSSQTNTHLNIQLSNIHHTNDPWRFAKDYLLAYDNSNKFTFFPGVVLQGQAKEFYAQFCTVNDAQGNSFHKYGQFEDSASHIYTYFIFQGL